MGLFCYLCKIVNERQEISAMRMYLFYVAAVIALCMSCRDVRPSLAQGDLCGDNVDGICGYIKDLAKDMKYDSLYIVASEVFYGRGFDTSARLFAGIYAAKSYLLQENLDSAGVYLEYLRSRYWESLEKSRNLLGMFYTVDGVYRIKSGWDFPNAFLSLNKSCEIFQKNGDYRNMVPPLANIVQFFYTKSDIQGLEYAEKAYGIACGMDDPWIKCISSISMAQMLLLQKTGGADPSGYIREADKLAVANGYSGIYPLIKLLYADYYRMTGENAKASDFFAEALDLTSCTDCEPAIVQLICLKAGNFMEKSGNMEAALELFRKGLASSYSTGNLELRDKLLLNISDCAMRSGDSEASVKYYRQYLDLSDSLELNRIERDFDEQVRHYMAMEYQYEMKSKIQRLLFLTILCVVLVSALLVLNAVQRNSYRKLAAQYRNHMKQMSAPVSGDDSGSELWVRLENAMVNGKLYLRNNITLESLAEEIGTNRTYLSKTINRFSGNNFNGYIDKYRIREAALMIESDNGRMTFKQLAEAVGYNSLPVFYKAFSKETGLSPGKYRDSIARKKS